MVWHNLPEFRSALNLMAKPRTNLKNAPITEALIDFQGIAPSGDLKCVQRFADSLKDKYEIHSPIVQIQMQFAVGQDESAQNRAASRQLGIRLHSKSGKDVIQVRTNGLTFSRLEPYDSWESLVGETRSIWTRYCQFVALESISRVATRFINNLKLPMKADERFEEYLSTPPGVPKELPQGVLGFMQHVVLLKPELNIRANVTQLLQEGHTPADYVPIILDIDVYKQVTLPADEDELWTLLSELRQFKNEIFFASLMDKAVELFE